MTAQRTIIRICAIISGISGFIILFTTLYPIAEYEWSSSQKYPLLLSPLVDEEKAKFVFSKKDYTHASNWFDDSKERDFSEDNVSFFTLTIPKLGIKDASVSIGGDNLLNHLVQYPGTALPGKIGNAVIFGHSILPQYFDPKNYLSIFSTLPTLDIGDEIYANYDGVRYEYKVSDMFEVRPADVQILDQDRTSSFLTLVTCTPPGHPLKPRRLIVRAKIVDNNQANANFGN